MVLQYYNGLRYDEGFYLVCTKEALVLKDMISKIVEMDEKAREIVDEGKRSKVDCVEEIAQQKEQIRKKMFNRANKKIEQTKKVETEKANKKIEEIKKFSKKKSELMNEMYMKKCDQWVDDIVKRVLEE